MDQTNTMHSMDTGFIYGVIKYQKLGVREGFFSFLHFILHTYECCMANLCLRSPKISVRY